MTYIRQCPDCKVITEDVGKNRAKLVPSIVILTQVDQVQCFKCKAKNES